MNDFNAVIKEDICDSEGDLLLEAGTEFWFDHDSESQYIAGAYYFLEDYEFEFSYF